MSVVEAIILCQCGAEVAATKRVSGGLSVTRGLCITCENYAGIEKLTPEEIERSIKLEKRAEVERNRRKKENGNENWKNTGFN